MFVENDPAYVDALLKGVGLSSDAALRSELIKSVDVTTLSLNAVETYASSTGHQDVKELLTSGQAKNWIVGRQLIDLIGLIHSLPHSSAHLAGTVLMAHFLAVVLIRSSP
jgi:sulfite reductase (NADPH) flavoprotein alpha-component